jgi:4,5-DOPA dioxygenase extradiol
VENVPQSSLSPILYFPHGGGPLPLLGDPGHKRMVNFLRAVPSVFNEPSAILVISAHWEEREATITSGGSPALLYDYYGFPVESYQITYPSPGSPELAQEVRRLLAETGFQAQLDAERGFDHGMFVPLKLMYPKANIPCVQLSLVEGLDPAIHLQIGKAIAPLRRKNVLILGSGFSFHNLNAFFSSGDGTSNSRNGAFQDWLIEACTNSTFSPEDRRRSLVEWQAAPFARFCHPREEHLLPLHVCCGAADTPAKVVFDGNVIGKRAIALLW